jgi:hypothetical protein
MSLAPEVALAEILKSSDVAPASAANARIVGDDPVIPTRLSHRRRRFGGDCGGWPRGGLDLGDANGP